MAQALLLITSALLVLNGINAVNNNVCNTWSAYNTDKNTNPACSYNSDADSDINSLARNHGFSLQSHNVTTPDGYILQIFHLLNSDNSKTGSKCILLCHGIYMNAQGWMLSGNLSMAYVLAGAGFDVWLCNLRGTAYSLGHVSLNYTEAAYWDFSLHEMGIYDMPTIVNFVYEQNEKQKIQVIGFSMSTTVYLIYASWMPEHADTCIKQSFLIAPITQTKNLKSILYPFFPVWPLIKLLADIFGVYYVLGNSAQSLMVKENVFLKNQAEMEFYMWLMGLIFGPDRPQFNPMTLPVTVLRGGDSICMNVITHYVQLAYKRFCAMKYYKDADNIRHYNSSIPPCYNITTIRTPMMLISALNDRIASPENVDATRSQLPAGTCSLRLPYPKHNHQDFVIAKDEYVNFYTKLIQICTTPTSC